MIEELKVVFITFSLGNDPLRETLSHIIPSKSLIISEIRGEDYDKVLSNLLCKSRPRTKDPLYILYNGSLFESEIKMLSNGSIGNTIGQFDIYTEQYVLENHKYRVPGVSPITLDALKKLLELVPV